MRTISVRRRGCWKRDRKGRNGPVTLYSWMKFFEEKAKQYGRLVWVPDWIVYRSKRFNACLYHTSLSHQSLRKTNQQKPSSTFTQPALSGQPWHTFIITSDIVTYKKGKLRCSATLWPYSLHYFSMLLVQCVC